MLPNAMSTHRRFWAPASSICSTLLTSVLLASGLSTVLVAQQSAPLRKSEPAAETPVTMPIELIANRPIVRLKIGDQGPFALLVAPEAQATLIDRTLFPELKPKAEDAAKTSTPDVDIGLGPMTLRVRLADMAGPLPDFSPTLRPRGILSASAWANRLVTIDYPRYQLIVDSGTLPDLNGRDVFELNGESPELGLTLGVAGHTMPCQLDPAFPGGFLIPEALAKLLPTLGRSTNIGSITIASRSVFVREVQLASDATLGMFEFPRPVVQFGDTGEVCKIGGQRLLEFAVTYDMTHARVRLARRPQR